MEGAETDRVQHCTLENVETAELQPAVYKGGGRACGGKEQRERGEGVQ